jgi:hypothetical protein
MSGAILKITNLMVGCSSLFGRAIEGLRVSDTKAFAISGPDSETFSVRTSLNKRQLLTLFHPMPTFRIRGEWGDLWAAVIISPMLRAQQGDQSGLLAPCRIGEG